jgi:hypothetical protein
VVGLGAAAAVVGGGGTLVAAGGAAGAQAVRAHTSSATIPKTPNLIP